LEKPFGSFIEEDFHHGETSVEIVTAQLEIRSENKEKLDSEMSENGENSDLFLIGWTLLLQLPSVQDWTKTKYTLRQMPIR
jgi:hypothetical protein